MPDEGDVIVVDALPPPPPVVEALATEDREMLVSAQQYLPRAQETLKKAEQDLFRAEGAFNLATAFIHSKYNLGSLDRVTSDGTIIRGG